MDTKKELRRFGLTLGIVLSLLGGLMLWHKKDFYFYFFILSAISISLGLFRPAWLGPVYKVWMSVAAALARFITTVVLMIIFYVVVTPVGLIAGLFGKNFLDLKFAKGADSYWIPKKEARLKREDYEKQF